MISETMVLQRIKLSIGDDIFNVMPAKWFLDIITSQSLVTWGTFYPKFIRGIEVLPKDAIKSEHPQTRRIAYYMYKIPKQSKDTMFINIEDFFCPLNTQMNQMTSSLPILNATMSMALKATAGSNYYNSVRYTIRFQPPDIAIIDPPPPTTTSFSLIMSAVPKLYEIPMYYREYFMQLCECDVKLALFAKFQNLADGSTYQGLEVRNIISTFSDAKSERKDLLDTFSKDYFKDPNRSAIILKYALNG
jgi:hypothetical protein